MSQYYKVEISAETADQASDILDALLAKKLVTGGQILGSPARFLWKGDVVNMDYITITSFTLPKHKEAIVTEVKKASLEEVPMVVFIEIDGNDELLEWVERTVS